MEHLQYESDYPKALGGVFRILKTSPYDLEALKYGRQIIQLALASNMRVDLKVIYDLAGKDSLLRYYAAVFAEPASVDALSDLNVHLGRARNLADNSSRLDEIDAVMQWSFGLVQRILSEQQ